MWPFRKKKEVGGDSVELIIETQMETELAKGILLSVNALASRIAIIEEEEKEYKPMGRMKRIDIAMRLKVLFKKLRDLEEMMAVDMRMMTNEMKKNMDPLAREDLDFDMRIEKRLKTNSLRLHTLMEEMLNHFEKTGDRRYVYTFLNTAAKVLKGEIKSEKAKRKIVRARAA